VTLEELLADMPEISPGDLHLIEKAYSLSEEAHRPQLRKSGEPYFVHVAAVARILAQMGMDTATVAAGLLHDVVEDTDVGLQELEDRFGREVAMLVDGVTKIDGVADTDKMTEPEYLRKTINAMSHDVRVILIKLADRMHNMRTLGSLSPKRQQVIAQETMELFAPLATRLGMWGVKSELEELAFRYLEPEEFRIIAHRLQSNDQELNQFVERVAQQLQAALIGYGIQATIRSRPRNIYHIYKEMLTRSISLEETYDVRGIRILVEDKMACYQTLGILHQIWRPVPGKVNDYIGAPKDSFYQSLHTTVFHDQGSTFEVQIRTWEMDYRAEYGIAAYWRYKGDEFKRHMERPLAYLRSLIEPAQVEETPEAFLQSIIENIDSDRIYVLTPRGDILDLPRGATPIDFAYHIHTEVGDRCRAARVNGKLVPLDYTLQKGDQVQIYTAARGGPSLEWLEDSRGFVYTNRAKSKIHAWFRKQNREKLLAEGQAALLEKMEQFGLPAENLEALLVNTKFESLDDLYEAIGQGRIAAADVAVQALEQGMLHTEGGSESTQLPILGAAGYQVKLARCCHPTYGDSIAGYITRQAKVSVHRSECPVLNCKSNIHDRLIRLQWGARPKGQVFPVPVELRTLDRTGMMGDIGAVVASENINLSDVNISARNGQAIFHVTMEIDSYATLSRVLSKLESLDGVIEARRHVTVFGDTAPMR
jgi:GTP diphosphokinase / guanosine-3',5'-bis(diphosphate) 3'-diphosphatase